MTLYLKFEEFKMILQKIYNLLLLYTFSTQQSQNPSNTNASNTFKIPTGDVTRFQNNKLEPTEKCHKPLNIRVCGTFCFWENP